MKEFIKKHEKDILGVLSGFDRVRFRGTIRVLAVVPLLMSWLAHRRVLIKDFADMATSLTLRLKSSVEEVARQCVARRGVTLRRGESPVRYLRSSKISKEDLVAERIAIASYREIIEWLESHDSTTRTMLEGILAVEEEHANDLAGFLTDLTVS